MLAERRCKYCRTPYCETHKYWASGYICAECWETFEYDDGVDCKANSRDGALREDQIEAMDERIQRLKSKIREHRVNCIPKDSYYSKAPALREYAATSVRRSRVFRSL